MQSANADLLVHVQQLRRRVLLERAAARVQRALWLGVTVVVVAGSS
jgi:hypothetical protein